jgi:hypothetical protein
MANAGPVDVLAGGSPLFEDLANGNQASADVPSGSYDVAVDLVGGGSVIPTTPVDLPGGTNTIVHVIGGSDSDPSVLVQQLAVEACAAPVESTTSTTVGGAGATPQPSPATPAAPATAVRAQPAVTG